MKNDRVGLGWRPELAAGIFSASTRSIFWRSLAITISRPTGKPRLALKMLSREVPVHIHSIDLGMAGAAEVSAKRVDRLARLINDVEPEVWSEHLAFVRAGELEIGHLAAAPRNEVSVEGTARNVKKAAQIIGSLPLMENIATLLQPPCSTLTEQRWISDIVAASDCGILLDLHNLYANATNFGFDPLQFLEENSPGTCGLHPHRRRPVDRLPRRQQAVSAGDHLHEVTDPIYDLLAEVASAGHSAAHGGARTRWRFIPPWMFFSMNWSAHAWPWPPAVTEP